MQREGSKEITHKVIIFGDILHIYINKPGSIAKLTQPLIHQRKMKILDKPSGRISWELGS